MSAYSMISELTPRDKEIIALISEGISDKEAAATLGVAVGTVKHHLRNVKMRLGLSVQDNRVTLVNRLRPPSKPLPAPGIDFTPEEWQIVTLVADGKRNIAIGEEVGRSEQVVKNLLRIIYNKTGMSTRLELANWYFAHYGTPKH